MWLRQDRNHGADYMTHGPIIGSNTEISADMFVTTCDSWKVRFRGLERYMCWPNALGGDAAPSVAQIVLRLAYHLHLRTREPEVAEAVLRGARITRRTLSRYACYQPGAPTAAGDLHAAGPRRLDLYAAICLAMGENPGKVLWAATVAGDYASMLALLHAEVHLRPKLLIADPLAGPDSAELEVVPIRRIAGG